jgi:xylan 1,4-beta-xylosidase
MPQFNNPIIPGFHPDPSICRVGEDYYIVTSSFEYFPGVPIFHSRDLAHWRQIGYCLDRPSQLPLEKAGTSGGIYAPSIRYHDGLFYMVTTNTSGGGHFWVTAADPAGPWSEPVWIDLAGIDPSLLFDDDGKVYFTCTGLTQSEIDPRSGKRIGETRVLWPGTGGAFPEGPHLYKINGIYYLMIAEGGTEYGHMETIARSDSPWGPFESCHRNPILSHRSYDSPIQATGHADLLQDHRGNWWLVCLGIRTLGYPRVHILGRETFLAPVTWENGWPAVGDHGRIAEVMEGPLPADHSWDQPAPRDDFDAPKLSLEWNFLRNPRPEDWSLSDRPGWLRLYGSAVGLDAIDSPAWVGRRQECFDFSATALLDFQPQREGEEAGLDVRMNEKHRYEIAVTRIEGRRQILVRRTIGSLSVVTASREIGEGPVQLRIAGDRDWYRFSWAAHGDVFEQIAQGEPRYLATEVAGGFTGVYLAMYAVGAGARASAPADFDWFEYQHA